LIDLRADATPFRWHDAGSHASGDPVVARGWVGAVTLRRTHGGEVWAEFQLGPEANAARVTCLSFPGAYRRLRTSLEPGQLRSVLGRVSHTPDGPELHVLAWG
jgi:hypothetical protein